MRIFRGLEEHIAKRSLGFRMKRKDRLPWTYWSKGVDNEKSQESDICRGVR